jgi:hypothetical protein
VGRQPGRTRTLPRRVRCSGSYARAEKSALPAASSRSSGSPNASGRIGRHESRRNDDSRLRSFFCPAPLRSRICGGGRRSSLTLQRLPLVRPRYRQCDGRVGPSWRARYPGALRRPPLQRRCQDRAVPTVNSGTVVLELCGTCSAADTACFRSWAAAR